MDELESDGTQIEVVRVFTDAAGRFGNPLGIVRADEVVAVDHQALAARAGYSETVVIDEPADGRTAMRIYTPTKELPFAGHPSVGAAWWLSNQLRPVKVIDVPAGPVEVETSDTGLTWIRARAEWTPTFSFDEVATVEDLMALRPDDFTEGQRYVWTCVDERRGTIRSRMFAPALGIAEDEATGAAAVAITAVLRRGLIITQGRGSQLFTEWDSDGWVRLGGRVVADYPVVV
ncbi:PhzF family phenazine biosynthesis protein [Nocardia transvalensis]|uniref:PhzF family phenazine biosynthesis protein n=1 Tax=Nocardia transvalensis TaxID=37333 RepID=UPI0018941B72|nr:PhzF family phenazine biosynthesis protein [Nocardia transvalensis]MBF6329660.1 PhzF family phenazine biosynthesis protein [Nocardia transvalensis]